MLLKCRRWGVLLLILWLAVAAQAQMPDFAIKAGQAINARYGQKIDLNNVYWDYKAYTSSSYTPKDYCPDLEANAPAVPATAGTFMVVKFQIIRDGVRTDEIWYYLVYSDLSYAGPCQLPPPPTPVPTAYIPPTRVPPTATVYLSPTPSPTTSACFGLMPRLAIGQQGRVTPGDPNNIRADHGASTQFLGEIPGGGVFDVLDGPRCTGDGTWWLVSYNGIQGWTLEGKEGTYFTEPASFAIPTATGTAVPIIAAVTQPPTATPAPILPTATPAPIICNAAIPPRLHIGESARVTAGGIPNNMRQQQGRSSQYVGEIPPLGIFTVLEGPACTGDGAWWKVDYNGIQGWTLEGMEAEYWVEPLLPNLQPITVANLSQIRPLPNWSYQSDGSAVILSALTNDGKIFGGIELGPDNLKRWTPIDPFASGDTLAWTMDRGPRTAPIILNKGAKQWEFYDVSGTLIVSVSAPNDLDYSSPLVSSDRLWGVLAQGPTLYKVGLNSLGGSASQAESLPDVHGENILVTAFSADSHTLVTISAHKIYAWDTATWQPRLVHTVSASDRITEWTSNAKIAVSGTGQFVFIVPSGQIQAPVNVFLAPLQQNGPAIWTVAEGVGWIASAVFVRDEWILAGGVDVNQTGLLMALPRDTLIPMPINISSVSGNSIDSVAANPNGTLIAVYSAADELRVFGVWPQP